MTVQSNRAKFIPLFVQQAVGQLQSIENQPIETEFALLNINKPMGVSGFQLTEILPGELKSSLPSISL